jgi:translation initiation factor IF-2
LAEKMRVHILAKELNVPSKVILEKCRAEGLGNIVKNHMSTVSAGLDATIREWFSEGTHDTTLETAERVDLKKVRRKRKPRTAPEAEQQKQAPQEEEKPRVAEAATMESTAPAVEVAGGTEASAGAIPLSARHAEGRSGAGQAVAEVAAPADLRETKESAVPGDAGTTAPDESSPVDAGAPVEPSDAAEEAEVPAASTGAAEQVPAIVPADDGAAQPATAQDAPAEGVRTPPIAEETAEEAPQAPAVEAAEAESPDTPAVAAEAPAEAEAAASDEQVSEGEQSPEEVAPAGPQNVPVPAKLKGPRVVRYEAPDQDALRRPAPRRSAPAPAPAPAASGGAPGPAAPADPARGPQRTVPGKRGRVNPRRQQGRLAEAGERLAEWRDQDLVERRARLAGATGRRHRRRTGEGGGGSQRGGEPQAPTKVMLNEPVRMKDFCAATGLNFMQLFQTIQRDHDLVPNINMTLPNEVAELLALSFGLEVEIIPAKTKLDQLEEEFAGREMNNLKPRPPVVTVLGHVDHGKTSLLDAIRNTKETAAEDGGITQHTGASYLETDFGVITFVDTPGHEAFTAMRARGAQMTDVVILVVAADDGVMPQTVEAINHAKAAEVPIVVALTKIDLGDQNVMKIYGQLAEHGLTPSGDWGGEVDVIPTSVVTRQGLDALLEHIVALGEVLDLKADPTVPAGGLVIEAETKEGVGAVARALVQVGTLNVGDVVVCGNAFGKVRALSDARGRRIKKAGPSMPVEIWGLDDVPQAGDKLFVVNNVQAAKDVAAEVRQTRLESGRQATQKVRSLEEMFKRHDAAEIPELNLIVKADVDGSVAALRQMLEDIPSDEVRLVLRHVGVGAVTDSDVLLAATSNGIIVAYRVDSSAGARRTAERHGVDVRSYRVIYEVVDDIRKALEGLLAPEQRVESRATVEVRDVFRISKVGMVAGCYVTDGAVERNHLAKVVRNGVIIREKSRLASLRRFKDDVKEVKAGMECGIRLEGFDDLHAGDVIETYEIVEVARTL